MIKLIVIRILKIRICRIYLDYFFVVLFLAI